MTFKELAYKRQSDRKYDPNRPVPRELVEQVLDVARMAPSATNSQPWHFIVIDEPELIVQVGKALTSAVTGSMNKFAATAPVLTVVVEEPANTIGKMGSLLLSKHLPAYDLGIITSYITLAAADVGLGSCIMGWVDEPKVKKLLGIPRKRSVPLVISLGYSLENQKSKKRKELDSILTFNKYK